MVRRWIFSSRLFSVELGAPSNLLRSEEGGRAGQQTPVPGLSDKLSGGAGARAPDAGWRRGRSFPAPPHQPPPPSDTKPLRPRVRF
ncbi:hypothetical protein K1T71_003109 [Dendrolimus kikuchii]|uniref:Uncharacterized protein n=1 Tax=Dendrolimus kikuchii TaxID=765133 RepID=A0ACC1DAM5_9NEOP|nr:hypothetical protein K1T71_003109 [Dendrolimus kikuchii]